MLMIQKSKRETYDITTIRISSESHLQWKNHLRKKLSYFRIYADFEADNEIDKCIKGKKQLMFRSKIRSLKAII